MATTPDLDLIGSWHRPVRVVTAPLRERWLDVTVENPENVPVEGAAILAANHLSFIDSPLLMFGFGRRVTFLGKAEYLGDRVTRILFPRAGMIPVDRTGRGVGRSLRMAEQRLDDGELVGIFPEGSRSRDGRLHRGHQGAAHLALRSGAPIIPIGIVGTDAAMPVGRRVPLRSAPITLRIGAPIGLGEFRGRRANATVKQELTDHVMAEIAALSGQAVVDEFLPIPV